MQVEAGERHTMDVSDKHATLKIAGASRTDKGLYTLKLANPQGRDDASFFVTVTGEYRWRCGGGRGVRETLVGGLDIYRGKKEKKTK